MQEAARSVTKLPCGHWMCLKCLLECVTLALISPKHMPPICEGKFLRGIVLDWIDPLVSAEVSRAYKLLEAVHDEISRKLWTCPRCRATKLHLIFTRHSPDPVWKSPVECAKCYTSAYLHLDFSISQNVPSAEYCYCLFCAKPEGSCRCREWLDTTIESLVTFLRHNEILSHKVLMELQIAGQMKVLMTESTIGVHPIMNWMEVLAEDAARDNTQAVPVPKEPQGRESSRQSTPPASKQSSSAKTPTRGPTHHQTPDNKSKDTPKHTNIESSISKRLDAVRQRSKTSETEARCKACFHRLHHCACDTKTSSRKKKRH